MLKATICKKAESGLQLRVSPRLERGSLLNPSGYLDLTKDLNERRCKYKFNWLNSKQLLLSLFNSSLSG